MVSYVMPPCVYNMCVLSIGFVKFVSVKFDTTEM